MVIITWIGHACFRVKHRGYTVVFDPSEDNYIPGIKPMREKANMVICSHEHGDHNARKNVELTDDRNCPYDITEIKTFHDDKNGSLRGENTITILDDGEIRLAHFGDLGCDLKPEEIDQLRNLDVMFIPVGGYYTIDGKKAAEICKILSPKVVIPMHFRDDNFGFGFKEISTIQDFVENFENVVIRDSDTFDYDPAMFDGETMAIVLKPQNLMD